ncbi:DUF6976 family protein [Anaeromyxobacter paludicola]|uniref:Uncharacterized protein n=1 Tax=Anaeromyxobacter paludicola TaxID=2918171 RepID=A0ABN6N8J8_9BACT|nr:hypothetical protein [Anaeromyxobacter paludicola]BDG09542.1 hypothetical protein AMPC_26550 [Anaeromyxobacter paludicola]
MPRRQLLEVGEVAALLGRDEPLLLAGDEALLRRLPPGRWIAGTIPYFMTEAGGVVDRERIFVEHLPPGVDCLGIRRYGEEEISRVYADLPEGALAAMIAPCWSRVHLAFALHAPRYPGFATAPLFGWIAGVHLSELGASAPRVFDGSAAEPLSDQAIVMQLSLAPGKVPDLGIVNVFERGDGPTLTFPETGFTAATVAVDGRPEPLVGYLERSGLDTRLPLVADYAGASINVSFQSVDRERGEVRFFAPVFAGVEYQHARPLPDSVRAFASALPTGLGRRVAFSCNCVLNYVNLELEGRRIGDVVGPMTFGEIAYQLLNQTLVYLCISEGD